MQVDPNAQLDKINGSIKRWQSRLTRAVNAINKLERAKRRLELKLKQPRPEPKPPEPEAAPAPTPPIMPAPTPTADVSPDIPGFLRRTAKSDDPATALLVAEIADRKRRKAQGQAARNKAKRKGELKRMPLQGKDALKAIFPNSG